ncbi:MAG: ZPR1 zinc finger domain-containing protein [Candidatus Lokiarchaeota archaeon]|nr:ZPR1 zinc finger domain-containing protein [Candidatus Lokiarchaeota archaeon]
MPDNEGIIESTFKINCPACGSNEILINKHLSEVPYYGKILLITFKCERCRYKFNETYILDEKAPQRYILKCGETKDLNIRIIKSGNSTVHIPELEIDIYPGPDSEGIITNVEGLLNRVKDVIMLLKRNYKSLEELERIIEKLEFLNDMLEGKRPFTIIIEDPSGNSAIITKENLTIENLTPEEIKNLDTGNQFSIDLGDLVEE